MRTTVDIADELMRRAKKRAADEGVPLRVVVESALRNYLKGPRAAGGRYRLQWRPDKGRLRPGVQLDNRSSLHDLMDDRL
jgi:hypothetical protein